MNKGEIIDYVAEKAGLTKKDAGAAVDAVLNAIVKGSKDKSGTQIVGFGTFKVKLRKARKGINPATGKSINIPAKKKMAFKVSKNLKF